jgi:hypothetical protein
MKSLLILVILPLIVSNVVHMVIVKWDLFPALKIPLSEKLFGRNKTWRGILVLVFMNSLTVFLINLLYKYLTPGQSTGIGAALGLAYMLFELPNSWLKRRLGIAAGEKSIKNAWLLTLLDKTDSSLGVSILSWWIFELELWQAVLLFLISAITHALLSLMLVIFGVKRRF